MNEKYKCLANELIEKAKSEPHGKCYVSSVRSILRQLTEYLELNTLEFSPEIAASWLSNQVRPAMSYKKFKHLRVHVYRIACAFDTTRNLKPLFYDEEKLSPYDLLPVWTQSIIDNYEKYCNEKKIFYYHEVRLSIAKFLSFLIKAGFREYDVVDCRISAKYYTYKPTWSKGEPAFIRYLHSIGYATSFAYRAFNPCFHTKITLYDSVDISDFPDNYSLTDFVGAAQIHLECLKKS